MTTGRPPTSPPPCNQRCWTWVGQGHHHGWIYTDRADRCGHEPDGHGRWTWNRRPDPQTPRQTQLHDLSHDIAPLPVEDSQ